MSKLEKLVEELKSDKEHIITPKLVEPDVKNISESLENIKIENNLTENKVSNSNLNENKLSIDFSDKDMVIEPNGIETEVTAPKDLATLEKISEVNNAKRKEEEEDDDKLNIGEDVSLELDVLTI